jgi:hypothetical protein
MMLLIEVKMMHDLLEQYLEEVASQLKSLPAKRRNEELREIREHLLTAVTTHREAGLSEAEASANVVVQFGSASVLARRLTTSWRRERRASWSSWLGAAVLAFVAVYIPNWLVHFSLPLLSSLPRFWQLQLGIDLILLLTSFLGGVFCCLAFPKRAMIVTVLFGAGFALLFLLSNTQFLINGMAGDKLIAFLFIVEWGLCPLMPILGACVISRWSEKRIRLAGLPS